MNETSENLAKNFHFTPVMVKNTLRKLGLWEEGGGRREEEDTS